MKTERYQELFVNRTDAYATQRADGRYTLRRREVTPEVVEAHLLGRITCGWYAINRHGTCKWACLDADNASGISDLQQTHQKLHQLHISSYLEESREGRGHLWLFTEPMAPKPLRALLCNIHDQEIEVFPKQDAISRRGYGSLVRGPLGIHRKTGERYGFLDPATLEKVGSNLAEQLAYLETVRINAGTTIAEALAEIMDEGRKAVPEAHDYPRAEFDIVAVASQFTQLQNKGHYYVGLCPLHPERHHSFAVYPNPGRIGRWFCFHEYRGGDAISLYAEMTGLSYREAWATLREMELVGSEADS